ncbi:MAG: hypothetical protein QW059_05580 [Nitrososphaerota archaeon]
MTRCPTCSAPCVDGATYCPFCGSKIKPEQKTEHYRCWIHRNRFAPYRCEICGKLICRDCRYEHSSRPICKVCYISVILPRKAVAIFQQNAVTRSGGDLEEALMLVGGSGKVERVATRSVDL